MNPLHSIQFYPPELDKLTNGQKAAIVRRIENGDRVRVRITPVKREINVEYFGYDRWSYRNTWQWMEPDYPARTAVAARFDPSKIEVVMGRK